MSRDPRIDPKVGDVLKFSHFEVVRRIRVSDFWNDGEYRSMPFVVFEPLRWRKGKRWFSGAYNIKEWRVATRGCEVIHAAE